jgi:hypothetical protein
MKINHLNFYDENILTISTTKGYKIFTCDPFEIVSEIKFGDISKIEM